jgi:hypothetical protein
MRHTREILISNEAQAFSVLKEALDENFDNQDIRLKFDNWPLLEIELEGPGYKSTITSDMANALVSLQQALNRAYALSVHGQGTARNLTAEEKQSIQFKAKVEDGCSLIKVNLGEYAEKLSEAIAGKMTAKSVAIIVLGIAAATSSTVAYKWYLEEQTRGKSIQAESAKSIAMSHEETERMRIFARAISSNATVAAANVEFDAVRSDILKGTSDAKSLSVNNVEINQETARAATTKQRDSAIDIQLNGSYFVTEANLRKPDEIRIHVRRAQDGKEFVASFRDQSLDGTQIQVLKDAAFARTAVFLSINATELRGNITTAQVISVAAQPIKLAQRTPES